MRNTMRFVFEGVMARSVDWIFTIFGMFAFNSFYPFLLPHPDGSGPAPSRRRFPRSEKHWKIDEKGGKESELTWMGLAHIVSTRCAHPSLRQRIL